MNKFYILYSITKCSSGPSVLLLVLNICMIYDFNVSIKCQFHKQSQKARWFYIIEQFVSLLINNSAFWNSLGFLQKRRKRTLRASCFSLEPNKITADSETTATVVDGVTVTQPPQVATKTSDRPVFKV